MRTRKLQALKPHKYGTRHLTAGEEYEAPLREAVAMVVSRKARFASKSLRPLPQPPEPVAPPEPSEAPAPSAAPEPAVSELDQLRARATALGIEFDGRWGLARLRYQIGQAEGRR